MNLGRAIIMTLLSAALTVLCVWVALVADTEHAIWGLVGGLFFGAGTLLALSYIFPARIPPPDADGSTTIHKSFFRCVLMAIACAAIVVASVIAIPQIGAMHDWRAYAFYVIPIPCAVLTVMYLLWAFGGEPAYRFDANGLTRYQWGARTIPWSDITNVRTWAHRGGRHVVVDVTSERRRSMPWWGRLGPGFGAGDLTLSSMPAGVAPDALEALVRAYWERGAVRR
ncbi:MAG: PH domain-containing protein [Proteobacteria bacterium]|nr:PH domain-containing protein [Pseudomonadota bacterium]